MRELGLNPGQQTKSLASGEARSSAEVLWQGVHPAQKLNHINVWIKFAEVTLIGIHKAEASTMSIIAIRPSLRMGRFQIRF